MDKIWGAGWGYHGKLYFCLICKDKFYLNELQEEKCNNCINKKNINKGDKDYVKQSKFNGKVNT